MLDSTTSRPLLLVLAMQAALALYRACCFRQLGGQLPPEEEGQGEGRWQGCAESGGGCSGQPLPLCCAA
jgi:hypothetical protein